MVRCGAMEKVRKVPCCSLILLLCCGFLVSCVPKIGNISRQASDEVEVDLSKGYLLPGMHCYFSGSETLPHTIITLSQEVTFQQDLWQASSLCGPQVKEWLEDIDNRHRPINDMYTAGKLLDSNGQLLGYWYSKYDFQSGHIDSNGVLSIQRPLQRRKGRLFNYFH